MTLCFALGAAGQTSETATSCVDACPQLSESKSYLLQPDGVQRAVESSNTSRAFPGEFRPKEEVIGGTPRGGPKPFEFVRETSQEPKGPFPLEAPIELMSSESFLGGGSGIGGGGTGASRVSPSWQIVGE